MPTPRVSVQTISLKAGRVGIVLSLLRTCAVGILFALIAPPLLFAQSYGVQLGEFGSVFATDGVGGCTPPDSECVQKFLQIPEIGGYLQAPTLSSPLSIGASAKGNSASANVGGTASLGFLNADIEVDAATADIGAATASASVSLGWTDTITITSAILLPGTSVHVIVTPRMSSSISNPLACQNPPCQEVFYEVLPFANNLFINTMNGGVLNQGGPIDYQNFYVGQQIVVAAQLGTTTIGAGGGPGFSQGTISATATFNFDVCTAGASYITASGVSYGSASGSNGCGTPTTTSGGLGRTD